MSRVVVTVDETQNAPVINTPKSETKPAATSRLNLVLCIILGINSLLQLIAIFTPGWTIVSSDTLSVYNSVYYSVACVTSDKTSSGADGSSKECASTTFLKIFRNRYELASDFMKADLALDYNLRVRYQLNLQFSWFIVVGTTIFQILKYKRANEAFPRGTVINIMALMCACSGMWQVLYEAFAYIDNLLRSSADTANVVGFSYSVLFYALAFVQTLASTMLIVKQLFDYIRSLQCSLSESQVKTDTMKNQFDAEEEGFRRYRETHPNTVQLRPRSRGQFTDNRHSGENHSPRPSPRQSPRNSDNRSNARYRELLERSRAKKQVGDQNSEDTLHDRFLYTDEHLRRSRDYSPGPGLSSNAQEHSPRSHDWNQRPREQREYLNNDRESLPTPRASLLHSYDPSHEHADNSQGKSENAPRQEQTVIDHENIELGDTIVQDKML